MDEVTKRTLITSEEVAAMFGVDPKSVARWVKRGMIPRESYITTPGGHRRYYADMMQAIARGEQPCG